MRRNARDEATDQEVTARGTARRQAAEENLRRERLDAASRVNHPATDPSLPLAERVRLESQAAAAAARDKQQRSADKEQREREKYESARRAEQEATERAGALVQQKRDEKRRADRAAVEV